MRSNRRARSAGMKKIVRWAHMFLAFYVLSACTLIEKISQHTTTVKQVQEQAHTEQENFKLATASRQARANAQRVNRPWLAGKSVPLAREVNLPVALRKNVDTTLMYRGVKRIWSVWLRELRMRLRYRFGSSQRRCCQPRALCLD